MNEALPSKRQFSPAQSRAARGLLNCGLERIASMAAVHVDRLKGFETEATCLTRVELARLTGAYKALGVMPKAANKAGEGVRLMLPPSKPGYPFLSRAERTTCAQGSRDA